MAKQPGLTPLMQQYWDIKERYPDALLLFQVGDFYELFHDDAKKAAAFLGIALTARGKTGDGQPIPLCGVPMHARDFYVPKLVRGGFKVAICDQLTQPIPGTVVERGVTQMLTPGTLTDSQLLDERSASYIFSFYPSADSWGLLFGELLTAQLHATVLPTTSDKLLESELIRFLPDEVLLPDTKSGKKFQPYFKKCGYFTSLVNFALHDTDQLKAAGTWTQQFRADAQKNISAHESLRLALYHFYNYMRMTQESALSQFATLNLYKPEDFLLLDGATQRNLELVKNNQDGSRKNTLFSVVDGAVTSMGSRMIKKWLLRPLVNHEPIVQRQQVVQTLVKEVPLAQQLEELLGQLGDLERIVGRIALRRAPLHDYVSLKNALTIIPQIQQLLQLAPVHLLAVIREHLGEFSGIKQLLDAAINDDANTAWLIKKGFDQRLDQVRDLVEHSHQKILELEQAEQQRTGINSLKIRYNQVHGYYIEVTKANLHAVPDDYVRRQTLVGKERFIMPQLQELEHDITVAKTEINSLEQELFDRVKNEVALYVSLLRKSAHAIAHLDALLGFARAAYANGYVCPDFHKKRDILITAGRHPVVEQTSQVNFIPNDTDLTDEQSLWIITGPNMGGKSTYLRQVALISIMAQSGSFIPAEKASLPILDRVFTRIGAGDNLAEGKSTFLVEMEETASICSLATQNSLVILDEVGRGTSTFDGLAIAQAVVEHIYSVVQARCMFATHYHELALLKEQFPGIESYYAASKRTAVGVTFLYKIIKGVADGSFGVEVAKLAELPLSVIERSQEILQVLQATEQQHSAASVHKAVGGAVRADNSLADECRRLKLLVEQLQKKVNQQEQIFALLHDLDFDTLTPKKALDLIWKIKEGNL